MSDSVSGCTALKTCVQLDLLHAVARTLGTATRMKLSELLAFCTFRHIRSHCLIASAYSPFEELTEVVVVELLSAFCFRRFPRKTLA